MENEKAMVVCLEEAERELENEQKEKIAREKKIKKKENEIKKLNLEMHR